jgi:hypothetical protein
METGFPGGAPRRVPPLDLPPKPSDTRFPTPYRGVFFVTTA